MSITFSRTMQAANLGEPKYTVSVCLDEDGSTGMVTVIRGDGEYTTFQSTAEEWLQVVEIAAVLYKSATAAAEEIAIVEAASS